MSVSIPTPRTYHVRTLGCQMNVHDSERMAGLLEKAGYTKVEDLPEIAARATKAGDGGAGGGNAAVAAE